MFIKKICNLFESNNIPFAIVGGYAVALHGIARGTFDVDVVTEITEANFQRIEAALRSTGMKPLLPVSAIELFRNLEKYKKEKNLIAWNFYDPNHARNSLDIIITEDLRKLEVIEAITDFGKIPVLSIDALIAMKSKANRDQDKKDIAALKEAKDRKQ